MISYEEIKTQLANRLTSNTWNSLKLSMLGKELIAYGAQVIYLQNLIKQGFESGVNMTSVDPGSYYATAFACDIALTRRYPSAIKVKVPDCNTVVPPFGMKIVVGINTFYNIDYVFPKEGAILYQGKLKVTTNKGESPLWPDYPAQQVDGWEEFMEYTPSSEYSKYIKLSEYAYPNSIRVFGKNDGVVLPYTWYEPYLANSESTLFKVRVMRDGNVSVVFGNGVWSKTLDDSFDVTSVYYLDGTKEPCSITDITKVEIGSSVYNNFEVVALTEGRDCVVSDLRDQIIANNNSSLSSPRAISAFLKTMPFIIDSKVLYGNCIVTVVIKPRVQSVSSFEDINLQLSLKGDVGTVYNAVPGNPVYLKYTVHYQDVSDAEISTINATLASEYSYDNTGFATDFSTTALQSFMRSYTNGYLYITLEINKVIEANTTVKLSPPPTEGSLVVLYNVPNTGFKNENEQRRAIITEEGDIVKIAERSRSKWVSFSLSFGNWVCLREASAADSVPSVVNLSEIINNGKSSSNKYVLEDFISDISGYESVTFSDESRSGEDGYNETTHTETVFFRREDGIITFKIVKSKLFEGGLPSECIKTVKMEAPTKSPSGSNLSIDGNIKYSVVKFHEQDGVKLCLVSYGATRRVVSSSTADYTFRYDTILDKSIVADGETITTNWGTYRCDLRPLSDGFAFLCQQNAQIERPDGSVEYTFFYKNTLYSRMSSRTMSMSGVSVVQWESVSPFSKMMSCQISIGSVEVNSITGLTAVLSESDFLKSVILKTDFKPLMPIFEDITFLGDRVMFSESVNIYQIAYEDLEGFSWTQEDCEKFKNGLIQSAEIVNENLVGKLYYNSVVGNINYETSVLTSKGDMVIKYSADRGLSPGDRDYYVLDTRESDNGFIQWQKV